MPYSYKIRNIKCAEDLSSFCYTIKYADDVIGFCFLQKLWYIFTEFIDFRPCELIHSDPLSVQGVLLDPIKMNSSAVALLNKCARCHQNLDAQVRAPDPRPLETFKSLKKLWCGLREPGLKKKKNEIPKVINKLNTSALNVKSNKHPRTFTKASARDSTAFKDESAPEPTVKWFINTSYVFEHSRY